MQIRKKRRKEREALGDKVSIFCCQSFVSFLASSGVFTHFVPNSQAPPKEVPKTIENQRVFDETTVDPEDEEVQRSHLSTSYIFTGIFNNLLHVSRSRLTKQLMSFLHISMG